MVSAYTGHEGIGLIGTIGFGFDKYPAYPAIEAIEAISEATIVSTGEFIAWHALSGQRAFRFL